MHEVMFAERVLREARAAGAKSFIGVEVGELCEISVDELKDGLIKLTRGFVDESDFKAAGGMVRPFDSVGSCLKFDVRSIESKIECNCGFVGRAKILDRGHGYCLFGCPSCGARGAGIEVIEGGEIKIVEVE